MGLGPRVGVFLLFCFCFYVGWLGPPLSASSRSNGHWLTSDKRVRARVCVHAALLQRVARGVQGGCFLCLVMSLRCLLGLDHVHILA